MLFWSYLVQKRLRVLWLVVIPPVHRVYATRFAVLVCNLCVHCMVIQIRPGMPRRKRFQHRKKVEKEKRKERQKFSIPAPSQLQSPSEDPESSLQQISSALAFPCKEWSNQSPADLSRLQICKIPQSSGSSSEPLRITFNITVNADLSWSLFVHDHKVTTATCSSLETFSTLLDAESLNKLIYSLEHLQICAGQPDPTFVSMVTAKKGRIFSPGGSVIALIDNTPVEFGGNKYCNTVRTSRCESQLSVQYVPSIGLH